MEMRWVRVRWVGWVYAREGIGTPSRLRLMRRAAALASTSCHQSDLALEAVVEISALVVKRVQVVVLRKLPSLGLKVLGGFAVCL